MWHSPNQRVRAIANAKKRERERARRPFHIKRIVAHLQLISKNSTETGTQAIPVRVILNDLSMKGVGFFSQQALIAGQEAFVNISEPLKIDIRSRIVWCQEHNPNSHVLTALPFAYRLGVEFLLTSIEDQQNLKAFWEEIVKNYLYSPKAV